MFKKNPAVFYLMILAIISLILGFQYFNANSRFSQATSLTNVQIGFSTDNLIIQKNQPIHVDIFMKSELKVSGATISVAFPTDILEYQDPTDSLFASRPCSTHPRLKTFATSNVNQEKGYVTVSRVSIEKTSELPGGYFCFGTLTFIPKTSAVLPMSTVLHLDAALGKWQISGPQSASYIPTLLPEKSTLTITFDPTCSMKPTGDSNCDGVVDLTDFEFWRKAFTVRKYAEEADFNADRKVTMADFEIWRKGFFEYIAGTPTPYPTSACVPPVPVCDANGYCEYPIPPVGGWCPVSPTPIPEGGHMGWIWTVLKKDSGYHALMTFENTIPLTSATASAGFVRRPSLLHNPDISGAPVIMPNFVEVKLSSQVKLDPKIPVVYSVVTPDAQLYELFNSADPARRWARESPYKFIVQNSEIISLSLYPIIKPTCSPRPLCLDQIPQCKIAVPAGEWCPVSPTPAPTIVVDECAWCGTSCVDGPLPPDRMRPMVMPPAGAVCKRINGLCTAVTPSPTPVVQCNWCGTFCTSSANFANCPVVSPPAGMTCVQIGTGCRTVPSN